MCNKRPAARSGQNRLLFNITSTTIEIERCQNPPLIHVIPGLRPLLKGEIVRNPRKQLTSMRTREMAWGKIDPRKSASIRRRSPVRTSRTRPSRSVTGPAGCHCPDSPSFAQDRVTKSILGDLMGVLFPRSPLGTTPALETSSKLRKMILRFQIHSRLPGLIPSPDGH